MAFFVENENRNWATLHVNVIRLLFLFWVLISKTFKHSTVLESPNKWASLENNPKQIIRWGLGGMGGCHDNQECVLGTSWWKHTTKQTKRPNRRNINDQTVLMLKEKNYSCDISNNKNSRNIIMLSHICFVNSILIALGCIEWEDVFLVQCRQESKKWNRGIIIHVGILEGGTKEKGDVDLVL